MDFTQHTPRGPKRQILVANRVYLPDDNDERSRGLVSSEKGISSERVEFSSDVSLNRVEMSRAFLIKAGSIVGAGGLIFGYDIGVISTTITAMKGTIAMTPLE